MLSIYTSRPLRSTISLRAPPAEARTPGPMKGPVRPPTSRKRETHRQRHTRPTAMCGDFGHLPPVAAESNWPRQCHPTSTHERETSRRKRTRGQSPKRWAWWDMWGWHPRTHPEGSHSRSTPGESAGVPPRGATRGHPLGGAEHARPRQLYAGYSAVGPLCVCAKALRRQLRGRR